MDRNNAIRVMDELREAGVSDTWMIEHVIYRWMSGDEANEVVGDMVTENELDETINVGGR